MRPGADIPFEEDDERAPLSTIRGGSGCLLGQRVDEETPLTGDSLNGIEVKPRFNSFEKRREGGGN